LFSGGLDPCWWYLNVERHSTYQYTFGALHDMQDGSTTLARQKMILAIYCRSAFRAAIAEASGSETLSLIAASSAAFEERTHYSIPK
jgi:hypothetical protein